MSIFCRLLRKHYWGTPHREADNRLIQVCYECGAARPASELYNEVSLANSLAPRRVKVDEAVRQQLAAEPMVVIGSTGPLGGIDYKGNLSLVK